MYVRTREGLEQAPAVVGGWKQTRSLGMGSYLGEIRQGPDGRLYRWIERFDGLGNPTGLWTPLEKGKEVWRRLVEKIRALLAGGILNNANITLATAHVSRVNDNATARQNIEDTSNGRAASRSSYENAPSGSVKLDIRLLTGILKLAETYRFSISELAGGSHSRTSRHYDGGTVDVNVINGQHVSRTHPDVANFKRDCRSLGATEVLGPGDPDHATHIHCAWPLP
jgi:hypothetical protein